MATGYLARRNELAQERGFANYYEERQFRKEHAQEIRVAGEARGLTPTQAARGDPTEKVSYYENILVPIATAETAEATGQMRHDAMRYFKEQGYSEEEALEAMRELYGRSPGAE